MAGREQERQRERLSPQEFRELNAAETRLADRLDRLSAPLAERVLQKAIELRQQEELDDGSVSWDIVRDQ